MISLLIILGLFATGLIFTLFVPVYMPQSWVALIKTILMYLYAFDGFVPVATFFTTLSWFMKVLIVFLIYKILFGLIGLASGSGTPDI